MSREIIDSVLSGNKESFRELVTLYKDGAYNLALSILKNDFFAKDAVQQAFVNAWLNLHTFRRDAPFKHWFHRILINECFTILKKNPQVHQKNEPTFEQEPENISSDEHFDDFFNTEHLRFHIQAALEKMAPNYSLVLKLFYIESYSIKEISAITGWRLSDTKVKLHRARKSMKEYLTNTLKLEPEALYL